MNCVQPRFNRSFQGVAGLQVGKGELHHQHQREKPAFVPVLIPALVLFGDFFHHAEYPRQVQRGAAFRQVGQMRGCNPTEHILELLFLLC